MFNADQIALALAQNRPNFRRPNDRTREAAVAIILKLNGKDCETLFIKRAERVGDPWSGQMAFPGGHKETTDDDLCAAAVRETQEEIGLDLSTAQYFGALDHQQAQPRGKVLNLIIAPHVFLIEDQPSLSLNQEVEAVVSAPLSLLAGNSLHDVEVMPMAGRPTAFNGYRLPSGHFVWGLTYRILKSFFLAVQPDWEPPQEID